MSLKCEFDFNLALSHGNTKEDTMKKLMIFGNSGAGKSTLAKHWVAEQQAAHLDLDTIAWLPMEESKESSDREASPVPQRRSLQESESMIQAFIQQHQTWVIEGCYSDLLALVLPYIDKMIYLNLPIATCVENAKQRPWEPHKYPSKTAQDANLPMLIDWIRAYQTRDDGFSETAHLALYQQYQGDKEMVTENR